jgi:pyruvate dehydrogenase E2 component (dihydrolipoamide acetyltransferase)
MAIDVVMPQMGESIAEGTVVRWIKKPGEKVERDEPLLEISTDKVDAEIPSPAAGTLSEVLVKEGQTVAVNSVVARIVGGDEARPERSEGPPAPSPTATAPKPSPAPEPPKAVAPPPKPAPAPAAVPQKEPEKVASLEERRRSKSSPLVRKIAAENNVDISQIQGSGISGRVTKTDILAALSGGPPPAAAAPASAPKVEFKSGEAIRLEPLSVMRTKIAQHMILSKQTSAHVTTVFEVDFTNIEKLRRQSKETYAERGTKLTYLPFIVQAVVAGLRDWPIINASMDENNIVYHRDYNIGIAVALDWGLIVPVVKNADEKNILGLAKTINDLGDRARTKRLSPDDVQGGTFTITNPGVFGGLFGTPIINQPQVAILGVGGVKKRPIVVETGDGDFIAIRSMCILTLTFDHRLVDGAVADQFMAKVKSVLEAGQFTL